MHVTIYDAALREPESRVLDRAPCESAESLFENLCQNWAKRADELARFERELCATREAVQLSSDESDFDTVDKDDRACSRACDEDTRDSSARPRRNESTFCSEPPAKRRAKQRIKSFVTEESDADEDTEISLREILSRAVEDSVALRRRRVEKETERRKIIDTARERRDAGRTIARNLKRWHTRRMRKICVVQSVCRRWLALRRVRAVRDRRERLTRMFWVWRSTLVRARRRRACVRIQSSWRGYATRRALREDKGRRERVKRRVEEIVKRYVQRHERAKASVRRTTDPARMARVHSILNVAANERRHITNTTRVAGRAHAESRAELPRVDRAKKRGRIRFGKRRRRRFHGRRR